MGYASCSEWASHYGGFFGCGAQTLDRQAAGVTALGSVAVVPGLRCSVASGIFPDQGLKSRSLQVDS